LRPFVSVILALLLTMGVYVVETLSTLTCTNFKPRGAIAEVRPSHPPAGILPRVQATRPSLAHRCGLARGSSGAARAGAAPASSRQADAEAPSSRRAGARAAQPPREACGPSPRARLAPGVFCAAGCPPGAPVARVTPELSCAAGSTARRRHRLRRCNGGTRTPGPSPRSHLCPACAAGCPLTARAPRLTLVISCAADRACVLTLERC
jgi:hypothetical protein